MRTITAIRIWIVLFIVCLVVIPLALIAGPIRGIPLGWEFIDMSFGVIGIVPLIIVYRLIRRLERETVPVAPVPTSEIQESGSATDESLRER